MLYLVTVGVFFATPPGTSQILFMSNSLRHGVRRSLPTAAGDLTANAAQMLAAGFGLTALIASSAGALTIIKWAGVAYLVVYGLRIFFAAPTSATGNGATPETQAAPRKLFFQGLFTSAANPEAVVFFAALFPQFIDPALAIWPQLLILGVTYLVIDGAILVLMGLGAARLLTGLKGKDRLINRLAGAMMVTAAALLGSKDIQAR